MGRTYTSTFVIPNTECDMFRRWRLDALFVSMQAFSEAHADMLGFGYDDMRARGLFFALTRIHVHVFKPPVAGQKIAHTTWPGICNRFFCPRFHEFRAEDGTLLAAAAALWVILDMEKRSIVSPLKVDLGFPDTSDLTPPIDLPARLPAQPKDAQHAVRTPVYSEFDANRHVNNTKYIAWLCDTLGRQTLQNAYISDLTASYEKEIREEMPLDLASHRTDDAFTFGVYSEAGGKHFIAGGALCREVQP